MTKKTDYAAFNAALDKLMSNNDSVQRDTFNTKAIKPSTDKKENNEKCVEKGIGTIVVQVSLADGAVPVEGARVKVLSKDRTEIYEKVTDVNGKTDGFPLNTPSFASSQKPGEDETNKPYSVYDIEVSKNGFYTREFLNVAVFPGIASIQGVSLDPLGEDSFADDKIIVNENK